MTCPAAQEFHLGYKNAVENFTRISQLSSDETMVDPYVKEVTQADTELRRHLETCDVCKESSTEITAS